MKKLFVFSILFICFWANVTAQTVTINSLPKNMKGVRMNFKMDFSITVTDKKTGDVICTYNVKEFKGGRDFSIFDSFKESMRDLGSELAETK